MTRARGGEGAPAAAVRRAEKREPQEAGRRAVAHESVPPPPPPPLVLSGHAASLTPVRGRGRSGRGGVRQTSCAMQLCRLRDRSGRAGRTAAAEMTVFIETLAATCRAASRGRAVTGWPGSAGRASQPGVRAAGCDLRSRGLYAGAGAGCGARLGLSGGEPPRLRGMKPLHREPATCSGSSRARRAPPPPPPSSVLIGHAASFTPY